MACPCGSLKEYSNCCQPLHDGIPARSPEALMRSRYSGFFLKLEGYLLTSWHIDTRPKDIKLDDHTQWKRLEILKAETDDGKSIDGKTNPKGQVHFKAYYKEHNQWFLVEEKSRFLFENNHWFYHSGDYNPQILKLNRNDICLCGSGKKYKKCCL